MKTNLTFAMLLTAALATSCQSKQTHETESNGQTAPIVEAQIPVIDWEKLDGFECLQYHNRRFGFYVDFPYFMQMNHPPKMETDSPAAVRGCTLLVGVRSIPM